MRSGLYAMISLDGAPVVPRDAACLGLAPATAACIVRAIDRLHPAAVQTDAAPDRTTVLLGHLAEPSETARALGLDAAAAPVEIARAALAKHGAAATRMLRGEWTMLDWTPRETVLLRSVACGDSVLYAHHGRVLAIAPDLDALARLPWVERTIDPDGLAFATGRQDLRRAGAGRTILGGVRSLTIGEAVHFTSGGETAYHAPAFVPVAPFHGTFADAMAEVDTLLRRILRERLARASGAAVMLSGGLDSSLIAMLAAQERSETQSVVCLCSATSADSGIADESGFAQLVADRLGLPFERVVPPAAPSPYRPDETELLAANAPSLSPRHHVYVALHAHAATLGLPLVLDGSYGEWTATARFPLASRSNRLRNLWRGLRAADVEPTPLHVRLAPHRLAAATALAARTIGVTAADPLTPGARWGYLPRAEKMFGFATSAWGPELRHEWPFRDLRLLELFASFPAAFVEHGGLTRAPARSLMRGHLPDPIRLRRNGMAFAPDYNRRLQRHAPVARARIATFRTAGLDDWIDLAWLDRALRDFEARGVTNMTTAFETQMTAMCAEYLLWWQGRS